MVHTSLITGPERRRRWSEAEKLAVLAAAFAPGANVSDVSRRADIATSLIYRWRREFAPADPAGFAPLVLTNAGASDRPAPAGSPAIVVELAGGERVTIHGGADACLVAATLGALR